MTKPIVIIICVVASVILAIATYPSERVPHYITECNIFLESGEEHFDHNCFPRGGSVECRKDIKGSYNLYGNVKEVNCKPRYYGNDKN